MEIIKILILDDEKDECEMTAKIISMNKGYHADYVTTSDKAMKYLNDNPNTDIVLLDDNLGPRETGLDVLKNIKAKFAHTQVIMLTVDKSVMTGVECIKQGACDYINKPFDMELFKERAAMAIEKKKISLLSEKDKANMIIGMAEGLSHNINNRLQEFTLSANHLVLEINGLMKNNKDYIDKNPGMKKALERALDVTDSISNSIIKTGQLIKGVNNLATLRTSTNSVESVFLINTVIENVLKMMQTKKNIENLPLITSSQSEAIKGKETAFTEILLAVIENAQEAIEEKMSLLTDAQKKDYKPEIKLTFTKGSNSFIIHVKDNGIGITDENKPKIFAPYFTSKMSNRNFIGSSLHLIQRIIEEDCKGKIFVETDYTKGTVVFMEFPRNEF